MLGIKLKSHRPRRYARVGRRNRSNRKFCAVMTNSSPPLLRSLLAVPATSARFLEKAAQSPADALFIDLEDAVITDLKLTARGNAIAALNQLDWGRRNVSVRVNGLDTPWGCRDILDVVEACPRLDSILLPKCDSAADVHAVEVMIRAAEQAAPRERSVGIMGLIESARGVANVETIAQAGGRLNTLGVRRRRLPARSRQHSGIGRRAVAGLFGSDRR